MSHTVTSWFTAQSFSKTPAPIVRKFTIGSSDYSSRVMKWPSFTRSHNDIRPISLKMMLANADGGMNYLRSDKTLMENNCDVSFGFTHATSGDELIDMFSGKMSKLVFKNEVLDISITDKFKQLTERVVGTSDVPVSYTGSNYLPSDVAWWAITSYGGYDATVSSANTDINYSTFAEWASVFSGDAVFIEAEFKGTKVAEILRKLGRYTQSAIYIDDNKISFHRFGVADSHSTTLGSTDLRNVEVSFDKSDLVTKQYVFADYDTTSRYHKITVHASNSASANSFGLLEAVEKDSNVWYVNSASGINLAERKILVDGEPNDKLVAETGLQGFPLSIGETLTIVDDFFSETQSYRIMGHTLNMDTGLSTLKINKALLFSGFILDTSTLDGPDTLI